MPYWRRLLQADILPQKLSRRDAMVIFLGSSVCLNQHWHRRSARRKVSAIARSSPKFGRVTMIPSIRSRLRLNNSGAAARFLPGFDGSVLALVRGECHDIHLVRLQHAQHLLAATFGQMIGKNPRFPTIMPIVIFFFAI